MVILVYFDRGILIKKLNNPILADNSPNNTIYNRGYTHPTKNVATYSVYIHLAYTCLRLPFGSAVGIGLMVISRDYTK